MPEEKKKDSFTFSDKIKNSKPAAFKSFANRISSKIGSDGKPKKTLFERTKRDAPFFIAALVALLLLPFLYKYSGQVNEEPMVTPGSEESIFDPERYGFDTVTGDPEGQIAQLAGRDPLSLIKGFNSEEESGGDYPMDNFDDRSGLEDNSSYTDTSVEENNTNIYKRSAAPATRAAFRRAATKINPLASAGLTSRGGGKLGVGMWGGGLKSAAKKVSAEGPKNSPKPVSLQPLQAAGKPSRSYFGQGAAAEARRSKDAMSKANAMQALMDAQMKPIEPGKIGGLTGGSFGPGGGTGKLERRFAFNGKEPWWWDMMKRRAQMEWEADFNRKWDWIKWKDKLLQGLLSGVFSCLITGTDDWSMGKMFGAAAGAGNEDKCGKMTQADWDKCPRCQDYGKVMTKGGCHALMQYIGSEGQKDPWSDGNKNSVTLGPIAQRVDCLSNGLGAAFGSWWSKLFGKNKGTFAEAGDCNTFAKDGIYTANFSSTKDGWKVLHYVVGIPTDKLNEYYNLPPDEQKSKLVVGYIGNGPKFNSNITAVSDRANFVPLFIESVAIKDKKIDKKKLPTATTSGFSYKGYWGTNKGKTVFTAKTYDEAIAQCKKYKFPVRGDCVQAINEQANDVDKVKKMVALVDGGDLPTYNDFLAVLREGGAIRDAVSVGAKENLSVSTKGAKQGKDWVTGARCPYPLVRVSCDYLANISQKGQQSKGFPFAHLSFTNGMSGAAAYNAMKNRFLISYTLQGKDNTQPNAITSPIDSAKGQWFFIPHKDIRPFKGAWSNEITNAGFVTNSLGTERGDLPGKGDDYQIVATSAEIAKMKQDNQRVVITWQIRQCNSLDVDGSSINKGGCNHGNIKSVGEDGKVTGVLGQDFPGSVVSEVTCLYYDGSEPIGFPVDVETEPEPAPEPEPEPAPEPGKTVLELANVMNGKKGISDRFSTERASLLKMPELTVFGKGGQMPYANALGTKNCTAVGSTRKSGQGAALMFNQQETKAYIDSVIADTNGSEAFATARTEFVHNGAVSVPQLVDAMTIAYTRNPNAQVPLNVVCALGKTIAFNSYDPQMIKKREVWRNTFGAFVAYTGPDSSYYPAPLTFDSTGRIIADKRFVGCGQAFGPDGKALYSAIPSVRPYHYGRYNWSQRTNGDLKDQFAGSTGRDSYLNELTKGGWARNGFDASTYPLRSLAKAVGFVRQDTASDAELKAAEKTGEGGKKVNGTIDDVNRNAFNISYANIFNEADTSCGLQGNMPVSEALEYIGAVCINGKNAKPSNGNTRPCGRSFRTSAIPNPAGGAVAGEAVGYTVE